MGMTLRQGNREYFYENLDKLFPGVKDKYIKRYDNRYGISSPNGKKLWGVFAEQCERLGLLYDMRAIIHNYKYGYDKQQTLF